MEKHDFDIKNLTRKLEFEIEELGTYTTIAITTTTTTTANTNIIFYK